MVYVQVCPKCYRLLWRFHLLFDDIWLEASSSTLFQYTILPFPKYLRNFLELFVARLSIQFCLLVRLDRGIRLFREEVWEIRVVRVFWRTMWTWTRRRSAAAHALDRLFPTGFLCKNRLFHHKNLSQAPQRQLPTPVSALKWTLSGFFASRHLSLHAIFSSSSIL